MQGLALPGLELGSRGSALRTPSSVSGLRVWLDSRVGVEVVSGNVSVWANQADFGPAGNFQQTGPPRRPAYVAGAPPSVRFDETFQEYLFGPSPAVLFGELPLSIFIVASLAGSGPSPLLGDGLGTPLLLINDVCAVYLGPGGELSFPRNTAMSVRSFHHDGTDYYYREDGIELDRATKALGLHSGTGSRLGTDDDVTNWLSGDMRAVLFYSRATGLNLLEITSIEQYLTATFL